jgi:hypothetical protein
MVKLPIDHRFISQQLVDSSFWQEENDPSWRRFHNINGKPLFPFENPQRDPSHLPYARAILSTQDLVVRRVVGLNSHFGNSAGE